ncbi:LamG domain-containing protein [Kitasatospora paranensis]|uniref:LamG domain-containing protein n=1 Tax=Kitasatospora paranensis TaxID=258053 RepID=A0ABW2FRQ3_9ACTN
MSGGWSSQGFPPGAAGGGPDWAAMAEANERDVRRRKQRIRVIVGGAGAVALIGIVGAAVAVQGADTSHPTAGQQLAATSSAAATSAGAGAAPGSPAASGAADASPQASAPSGSVSGTPAPSATASGAAPVEVPGVRLGPAARPGTVAGHSGPALTLPGNGDGWAATDSGGIDTSASFTVSAVVSNSAATDPKAAVSQGGDAFFSLYLGRDDSSAANHNRWVFKVQSAAETGKSVMALSSGPAALGRWTTLTGVYDARAKSISLYVDGALAETVPVPGILPSSGPLQIGRARYKSHWVDAWNGSVADVETWAQPLSARQVAQLAQSRATDVPPRGSWLHS